MGNYTIIIEGHGINGNGTDKDADVMAREFAQALINAGQLDVKASFVYGTSLITQITSPIGSSKRLL